MSETESLSETYIKIKNSKQNTIANYIFELSKQLNIEDTNGVLGNELELIALVRNCQFLYDKHKPDFKDIIKKNMAWEAIAKVMHSSVNEVQLRWRNLREAYNKHKKDLELNKDNPELVKQWDFFEDMKFIEPYIVHRRPAFYRTKLGFLTNSDSEEFKEDASLSSIHESLLSDDRPPDILHLISVIQEKPILYNNKHHEYRNKLLKQQAWNEVAQVVGISAQECQIKWKALRERYGRERKLQNSGEEKRSWEYFDALLFLDSHVKQRRQSLYRSSILKSSPTDTKINMVNVSVATTPSTQDDATLLVGTELLKTISIPTVQDVENMEHVEFVDTSNPVSSQPSSPSPCESKISIHNMHLSSQSPISKHIVHDEDDLFGQTIAAELRRMPSGKKKMKIKADMYRLLYENESD